MIEFRVRRAAKRRGITTQAQLAAAIAASEGRTMTPGDEVLAGRLWKEKPTHTLSTVEKVLRALKGCEIGELLVYKADKFSPAKKAIKGVRKRR